MDVTGNRLRIDRRFLGDPSLDPVPLAQCFNCFWEAQLEPLWTAPRNSTVHWMKISRSKWVVLNRWYLDTFGQALKLVPATTVNAGTKHRRTSE
jgi:hypothetical protein